MPHIITTVLCGFFCVSCCAFCHKERKISRETEEKIIPFSSTEKASRKSPLAVGADLAFENIECSICLDNYEVGQPITILSCMHFYHENCLRIWNEDHVECPQCRENIDIIIID